MNITNDVERSVVVATVTIERLSLDHCFINSVCALEDVHCAEPFATQAAQGTAQLVTLAPYDVPREVAIRP